MRKKIVIFIGSFILIFIGVILYSSALKNISIFNNKNNAINEQNRDVTIVDVTDLDLGDGVGHQHLFKTQYDENQHWEECTLCHKKKDIMIHSFTRNWSLGYESCENDNVCIENCICGYSKKWQKPCVFDGKSYSNGSCTHFKKCSIRTYGNHGAYHGYYLNSYGSGKIYDLPGSEQCVDSKGNLINCNTSSSVKCVICGYPSDQRHSLVVVDKKLQCIICKNIFGEVIDNQIIRDNSVPAINTISTTIRLLNGATFNSNYGAWNKNNIEIDRQNKINNADGTITVISEVKFKSNVKGALYNNIVIYLNINGKRCRTSLFEGEIICDYIKPEISSIEINGGKDLTEWSRTKPIVVSGTENWCNTVKVKIVELENEENIIFEGETSVNGNHYTISCTPEMESSLARKNV